ncbi:putative oxidoreductase YcjS [Stieleria maiorica]|uniref:Putative oxidoreductase YcjS n=1 Tax=Stieleria maiorica TaxID=2795974 RepID=A0A5B9MJ46_9BACT|nr:Gfo/Idh/MocA family oxidoreductase [Stieleria maiorica]QEF99635.1 putative oxidoreductase YcjS [Stieleria maiorica]
MSSEFRIGIVGCGKISRRHVEACLMSTKVAITALVDPAIDNAVALSKEFGVTANIAANIDQCINELDGVIIAAPNNFHREIAITCAGAGVHVLIEKPIAGNSEDAEAICLAHERAGTVCSVGFVTRYRSNNRQMHRLIQSGYFGEITEFAYQFGSRGGWAPLSAYNLDKEATGGGVLVVTGSHFLDRMIHWFGIPTESCLWTDSEGGPEANSFAAFRFDREEDASIHGSARFSKTVALPAGFVMKTSKGIVSLVDSPDARIKIRTGDDSPTLAIEPDDESGNIFHAQVEDFVRACRGQESSVVSGRDALQSVLLTEELYRNSGALGEAPSTGVLRQSVSH